LETFTGRERRNNTVRHQTIVFQDVLKLVPWGELERLVTAHGADAGVRRLTAKRHLVALLYGQFSGSSSLREIETGLTSHGARLYHLGCVPVRRSTLADANTRRPAAVFTELFAIMALRAHRGLRRKVAESVYLIDATGVRLTAASTWGRFSATTCGAKVHVIYDDAADQPIYAAVSAANVNDITAAQAMPIEAGATYVFDLGYYDYTWWAKMHAAGCRIVTRFKRSTPLACSEERPVAKDGPILSDRLGTLPARQAASRKNPFAHQVREVCVRIESGKILRILSNDLKASAEEIADLYKRRWGIELFFRWVKQTLKIRTFLGTSENAVRIQVAVALIAFLLLRLAHAAHKTPTSPLAFARLVRANLMHRRRIDQLLQPERPDHGDQIPFAWAKT
jgi:hypothetical protein